MRSDHVPLKAPRSRVAEVLAPLPRREDGFPLSTLRSRHLPLALEPCGLSPLQPVRTRGRTESGSQEGEILILTLPSMSLVILDEFVNLHTQS